MCWQMIRIFVQTAKRPNWAKAAVVSLYIVYYACVVFVFFYCLNNLATELTINCLIVTNIFELKARYRKQ